MQEQSQQLMAASLSALTAQPSQSLDRLFATIEPHLMRLITEPTDEWLRSLQRIAYPTTNSQTMPVSPNSVMKSHSADQRSRLFMMESMETTASADSPQFYTPTETANPGDLPPFASGAVVAATVAKRQGTLRPKVFSKMFSRRKRLSLDGALDMRQTPAQQTPSANPFDMQQRVDKPSIIITSPPLPPNDLNE
jgi:hypothetical protein